MQIEVSERTGEAIDKGLSTGKFCSAEAFLEAAASDLANRLLAEPISDDRSLFERLSKHGGIGSCEGPNDLSTNPKHMAGFGQ